MEGEIKTYLAETMVLIEGGEHWLATNNSKNDTSQTQIVQLDCYYMNKYLVTQRLFELVMEKNPSYFRGKHRPVEQVDWYDAVKFCNTLSVMMGLEPFYRIVEENKASNIKNILDVKKWQVKINKDSKGYRLPIESEWEYAAMGGKYVNKNFKFSGSKKLEKVGWYDGNSHQESKEVGLKEPNQLGLYDMSGNVEEWLWSWYDFNTKVTEKNHLSVIGKKAKVVRGGSWNDEINDCQVIFRSICDPSDEDNALSFRITCAV